MRPKEVQQILGIEADRIKLFKRLGVFTPENPPSGNRGTNYTETDLENLRSITPTPASDSDTSFFMSVKLDNTRVIRDLQKYLDEVITHLTTVDNCEVELSLEVSAHASEGFP